MVKLAREISWDKLELEFKNLYLIQVDYVQPFAEKGKFEFGARGSFRDMENDYFVKTTEGSAEHSAAPELDNYFVYDENISAVYLIFGNEHQKFSYQLGLRDEFTEVKTTLRKTGEINPRTYNNLFPSAHFTYKLIDQHAIQLSYSRRIRRPVYNELSPFWTVSDSRSFNSGNPNLNPEYSNVYELGHIKYFEKGSLSSSVYYRESEDKIDRIRSVNDKGFATTLPYNLTSENAYGLDFTGTLSPFTWWKADLSLNVFHAKTDGSNVNEAYKAETTSWFVRHSSRFDLPKEYVLQLRANYDAPQRRAQGLQKAIFFFDLSARKNIWGRKGTLTLAITDILNSRLARTIAESPSFYTYSEGRGRMRQVNLTLNYRLKD